MRHKGMEGVGTKRRKKRWHKSRRYTSEERAGRARPLQKGKARRGNWRGPSAGLRVSPSIILRTSRTVIIARNWRGLGGAGEYERIGIVIGETSADTAAGTAGSAIYCD